MNMFTNNAEELGLIRKMEFNKGVEAGYNKALEDVKNILIEANDNYGHLSPNSYIIEMSKAIRKIGELKYNKNEKK